ncbi:metal-sulfur cluster assembly factor [Niallia sp. Krafla_26]|uniref:metal-sulfur cluster assembly factor n=1 Tax=Niallia sp. Krafla_26 TaxID=3064703 RepID=UPI003D175C4B
MEQELKDNIMGALENVVDPEIGIDIVNLGLVYDLKMDDDGILTVDMTLTSMGCPLAGVIVDQVQAAVKDIPEVNATNVNIVWNPPWDKSRMSRYAKIALGIHD